MSNKAVIGVAPRGRIFKDLHETARKVDRGKPVSEADYHLDFASAAQIFSELTPARLVLLETLKETGAQSIYALAKRLKRNYSNVHRDVKKLIDFDLVTKDAEGRVVVPWDEVIIRLSSRVAA